MRVLLFESGSIWSHGLPDGLRDLGHTVRITGMLTRQKIRTAIASFRPDLIMTVGWGPDQTKPKQQWIGQLSKAAHIPLIYWSTEDPNFTHVFTLPLIRRMRPDYIFTTSAKTARWFRRLGLPAAHMDFAYHASIHRRLKPLAKYATQVAVVANAYPRVLKKYPNNYRHTAMKILLRPLLRRGMRVDFYGREWGKMGRYFGYRIPRSWIHDPIPYPEANKVYSSAKIVLGLQNYKDTVTQRTYEILGSGGFLLTCDTPGVRKLVKPGRDVVVSASPNDTVRLVRRYLQDKKARERIRRQGRVTIAKHNYKNRATYLLRVLRKQGLLKGN